MRNKSPDASARQVLGEQPDKKYLTPKIYTAKNGGKKRLLDEFEEKEGRCAKDSLRKEVDSQ
jgi:hypothetical protein